MTETTVGAPDQALHPSAAPAPAAVGQRAGSRRVGWLAAIAVAIGTMMIIVAVAVLALTTPIYVHGALDRSGAAGFLGVSPVEAHALSDATVGELLLGPGSFIIPFGAGGGSLYDAAEASHLRDARTVLYGLLALAGLSVVVLSVAFARSRHQARFWRAVAVGSGMLVVAFVAIGALFLVAFDAAFTLFHEIFFPGGNWAFDFATQRLVQLYPIPFWEGTVQALGVIVVGLGVVVGLLARRVARRLEAPALTS
jgi:uncharacterized protein DUF1461